MKVLVTGAAGFLGSHLTEKLVESGYKVRVLMHYDSNNNWGWLENSKYKKEIEFVLGDIRDFDSVYSAMKDIDEVFHLAALIGIPYSYLSPLAYIKTNIEGTYNVLQSAKLLKTKNILITSTSETYGSAQYIPIDEKHPKVGQSPYSATKIGADNLAESFYRSFGLPIKIIRPFNIYGPRQSARAIIPSICIQILNNINEIKLGNVDTTRDLTFVKDTVEGFIKISKQEKLNGESTNIGMNNEISIKDLVDKISKTVNKKIKIITDKKRLRPDKSEVSRLVCDNSKIKKFTNWQPKYSLEEGLKETIDWLEKNKKLFKFDIYNQ
jgi:NAD dependent epimerase/dehydratase